MRLSLSLWVGVVVLLTAATSVPQPTAAAVAPWQELLSLDCAGNIRAFASNPILATAIDASLAHSYNFEFGNLLSAIERGSYDGVAAAQCSGKNFTVDAIGQHFGKYQLPSSCTAAGYNAGGACLLALPQSAFDVTLQLAVQRCPGVAAGATSKLPSVSLTCSGNGCKDLLVPCNTDSDCSGSVCTAFTSTTAAQIGAAFSAALNSTGLMPAASAQCTNDYKSNAGLKVFQAFSKAVGASLTGGNGVNAHEKTGFCGVAKYMPVELAGFSLRVPYLSSLVEMIPLYENAKEFLGSLLNRVPFLRMEDTRCYTYCWDTACSTYCYTEEDMSGFGILGYKVAEALSFFAPLTRSATSSTLFSTDANGQVVVAPNTVVAWDGKIADGSSATDDARRTGSAFFSVDNQLRTPSMAEGGVTPVQLLSVDCAANVALLNGQPISLSVQPPRGINALFNRVFAIVSDLQTCGAGVPLSSGQLFTRFNPLSVEFWLGLFQGANGFTPSPAESALPSLSNRLFPEAYTSGALKVTMPNTCTYMKYVADGQCSGEYTGLNQIFPGKNLNVRINIQRCGINPAGVPSLSLQCTGTDCNSMLSSVGQVKACKVDSDCGGGVGSCHLLSTAQWDGTFVDKLFGWSQAASATAVTCDTGVKTAQGVYQAFRAAAGVTEAAPTGATFGLCKLTFQSSVRPTGLDGLVFASTDAPSARITVTGLNAYSAPRVDPDGLSSAPSSNQRVSYTLLVALIVATATAIGYMRI